jgi:hypothetical protein
MKAIPFKRVIAYGNGMANAGLLFTKLVIVGLLVFKVQQVFVVFKVHEVTLEVKPDMMGLKDLRVLVDMMVLVVLLVHKVLLAHQRKINGLSQTEPQIHLP